MPYKDPEKRRKNDRERYKQRLQEDPEFRVKEQARRKHWREANPERSRAAPDPERQRERSLRWARANRERVRENHLWVNHGLRPENITEIWELQGGKCYLCQEPLALADVHIDHDHRCCPRRRSCRTCRRGLAHDGCNSSIGHSGDSPERLRRWADNLEAAQRGVTERLADRHEQLMLELA